MGDERNETMEVTITPATTADDNNGGKNGRSSPRSVYYGNKSPTERRNKNPKALPSRKISWHGEVTTSTKDVPRVDPELKPALFYNKSEISQFRAVEQRRIDKMMMKRIQRMVEEKMADEIEEAKSRGATPEDIEAMMPQTPEQIFEILGMPVGLDTMAPPAMLAVNDDATSTVPKMAAEDEPTGNFRNTSDEEHESIDSSAKSEEAVDDQQHDDTAGAADPVVGDEGETMHPKHPSYEAGDDEDVPSTNEHTTRKSDEPTPTQRTDYDVHGGWSNPLDVASSE